MRHDTLLFLINDDANEILLAMKKRGFGAGKYNGVGGKVGAEESIESAATREAYEEVGVKVAESELTKMAELEFQFEHKPEWHIMCHVFFARRWVGEPTESEEMAPAWYDLGNIPFNQMWVDDKFWLPMVLRGDYINASFTFTEDGSSIVKYQINGAPLP